MAGEAIVLFALLCYPTLLFLRWLLRPIWPTGKERGRTQFFICDYFVLLLEIASAMSAMGNPERYASGDLFIVALIVWIGIAVLWILCCRALSLMRVTRTWPRVVGLILIPLAITAAFGTTGATILVLFSSRFFDPHILYWWPGGLLLTCIFVPAAAEWIADSGPAATA